MSGPAQGTMSSQNQSGQPSPPGRALDLAVRSGKELEEAPQSLPSAWAAVLYLFNLR